MRLFANRPVINFNLTTPRSELFLYGFTKTNSGWKFLSIGVCVGDKILSFSYQRAQVNHLPIFSRHFCDLFYFFTFIPLFIYREQKHESASVSLQAHFFKRSDFKALATILRSIACSTATIQKSSFFQMKVKFKLNGRRTVWSCPAGEMRKTRLVC